MPIERMRICRAPGCHRLSVSGYCAGHAHLDRPFASVSDRERGSAHARGYDGRWRRARAHYLHAHPLCAECDRQGRVASATVVDHVVPHRGDEALFWAESNWQGLCRPCHTAKTARGE